MNCFFLFNYSSRLEKDHYLGSPGDYLFLLIFNWACCAIVGIFASLPVSSQASPQASPQAT
jgi:Derlin-1